MYVLHGTKKLLTRLPAPVVPAEALPTPTTRLGNWYATALFWKPQVALFVNERTLVPVFTPLAPAATAVDRFPDEMAAVIYALGIDPAVVHAEVGEMSAAIVAKTANRSVLGSMNDFVFMAEHHRRFNPGVSLLDLSVTLAGTPCGPLRQGTGFPDLELRAVMAETD